MKKTKHGKPYMAILVKNRTVTHLRMTTKVCNIVSSNSKRRSKMKTVSYIRVSSKGQGKTGLGLDSQRAIIKHYYPEVEKEFIEVESAGSIDRPQLQACINYCLKNKCWLVVAKVDRLSRVTEDLLSVWQKLNRNVSFCDIPTAKYERVEKFTLTLFAAIADRELELMSIRTKAALDVLKSRRGEWRKGQIISDKHRQTAKKTLRAKVESNPNNTQAAAHVCSLRKDGMSFNAIAKELNKKKFRTSQGGEFTAIQVIRLHKMFC